MTGINLNIQNSYASLYNSTQIQSNSRVATSSIVTDLADLGTNRGEQMTLSAEAIALSQQTPVPNSSVDEKPTGGGEGIRPPESSTLGGGEGFRPLITP